MTLALDADGKTLAQLADFVVRGAPSDRRDSLIHNLRFFSSIKRLGIGVRSGVQEQSPLEGIIAVEPANEGSFSNDLVEQLQLIISQFGLPLGEWRKKKIERSVVHYATTPLPYGIYFVISPRILVIASSQALIRESIRAIRNRSEPLGKYLASSISKLPASSVWQGYVDFHSFSSLSNLIDRSAAPIPFPVPVLIPGYVHHSGLSGGSISRADLHGDTLRISTQYFDDAS